MMTEADSQEETNLPSPTESRAARPSIRWSKNKIRELEERLQDGTRAVNTIEFLTTKILLDVVSGNNRHAEDTAEEIFIKLDDVRKTDSVDVASLLVALLAAQRPDLASQILMLHFQSILALKVSMKDSLVSRVGLMPPPGSLVLWRAELPGSMEFIFDWSLFNTDETKQKMEWFLRFMPLMLRYGEDSNAESGEVIVNQWDCGVVPGLAMSDFRPGYFLVPDNSFIPSRGYAEFREQMKRKDTPWDKRKPIAFWRGANTGRPEDPLNGWRSLPRVVLCSVTGQAPDLFDVGFSKLYPENLVGPTGAPDPRAAREIAEAGYVRPFVPAHDANNYKYQIDIDGNSNSWPGLFQKLLTGSPVLKISSDFRQWFYERLRPWINFVPVSREMTDLADKVRWLRSHDDVARQIGENGRALAISLDYDSELKAAVPIVRAAMRYHAREPEADYLFAAGQASIGLLRDGWAAADETGVRSRGTECHVLIPRPVAAEDFILDIEVSPPKNAVPRGHRIAIVVNSEILGEFLVSRRRVLSLMLSRERARARDSLNLTLLQSDLPFGASQEMPLVESDDGVILHSVRLTPKRIFLANGGSLVNVAGMSYVVAEPRAHVIFGPGVRSSPTDELHRVITTHGTALYVDYELHQLRHGPSASVPANAFAIMTDGFCYLLHVSETGEKFCIVVYPQALGATPDGVENEAHWPQKLRVVHECGSHVGEFGLRCCGLFMCAEQDGRITLSRSEMSAWERFHLIENC